ncbi:hypothetical protein ACG04R_14715 [Roseateles sp. BYS78W]|uniref:Uncharacterized protein n=1 Tax=Pelomonas candidula TaxID=3299025 RepID=A0ABW7HDF8_9BURK
MREAATPALSVSSRHTCCSAVRTDMAGSGTHSGSAGACNGRSAWTGPSISTASRSHWTGARPDAGSPRRDRSSTSSKLRVLLAQFTRADSIARLAAT